MYLFLIANLIIKPVYAIDCPNFKKGLAIGRELMHEHKKEFCTKELNSKNLNWIIKSALPQIMNKSFLGVNPPDNWQALVNEVIFNCYRKGNLCSKPVQEEFAQCAIAQLPLILFQMAPWMSENCVKMNQAVIDNWQKRKPILEKLLTEYLSQ